MGAMPVPPFRFTAETVVSTPGARIYIGASGQTVQHFVHRHWSGDWGLVAQHDQEANETALAIGYSVLSVFETALGQEIWLITDAYRRVTTVLTPSDY
jgi:hypothetical protein